jgi:hypothetical protein
MILRLFLALAAALLILRLPSLVQPMGADQGLYAYVADRILAGGLPYRDAWDQKPPAVHYTYAAMRAIWPRDSAVAAVDLLAAGAAAWLLYRLGGVVASTAAGAGAGLLFLLLSNPAFTRLAGVRLRAQCETFIGVAVAGALLLILLPRSPRTGARMLAAGSILGLAFAYKYNAGIYTVVALAAALIAGRLTLPTVWRIAAGFALPVVALALVLAAGGALTDAYHATISYNVRYSGETYDGPAHVIWYLATFPIERARVDALWTLGGAGCLVLLAGAFQDRSRLVAPLWVAGACISIAVNGSRGLPQYFLQANPALALAAGWGAAVAWQWLRASMPSRAARVVAVAACALAAIAVWRVNQFPKLLEQTWFDTQRALGRLDADSHLSRYADERKYSAIGMRRLADYLRAQSAPSETVYVFGFSPGTYVAAQRESASRFFWSRPVIVGFNEGRPGYGVTGLLDALQRNRPAVVALQRHDWSPDVADSAEFFMSTPALARWLHDQYDRDVGPDEFDVWRRKSVNR